VAACGSGNSAQTHQFLSPTKSERPDDARLAKVTLVAGAGCVTRHIGGEDGGETAFDGLLHVSPGQAIIAEPQCRGGKMSVPFWSLEGRHRPARSGVQRTKQDTARLLG
jgi:hypothetical protein